MDFICDIDGTLANIDHRLHHITTKPKNWPAFKEKMPHDTLNVHVADVVRALVDCGNRLIIASGRDEEQRLDTTSWLAKYGFISGTSCLRHGDIKFEKLYMRTDKDNRSDDIVKSELFDQMIVDGFDPKFVFDDRGRVVRMWRECGLFVFDVNQSGKEY